MKSSQDKRSFISFPGTFTEKIQSHLSIPFFDYPAKTIAPKTSPPGPLSNFGEGENSSKREHSSHFHNWELPQFGHDRLATFVLIIIVLLSTPHSLYAETALETMQVTVNDVLNVLQDPALKGEKYLETKKEKLKVIMDRTFNYTILSRQALGKTWTTITPAQQQEFILLYSTLLGTTYMNRIISYGDEKVDIKRDVPLSDTIYEVQSIIHSQNREIPVFYRLNFKDKKWMVFDVVIEGVSMTQNYRSQFRNFLSKKSMEDLLGVLKKKTVGSD